LVARAGEMTVANLNLTPVRASRVTVSSDAPRDPTVGLSVTVRQTLFGSFELPLPVAYMNSGPDSATQLRGLPPGHFKLTVNQQQNGIQSTQTRVIDAGGDTTEVSMADMRPASAKISGVLILDNGAVTPPPNSSIQIIDRNTRQFQNAKLGANGEFTFEKAMEPGTYQVFIVNVPYFILRGMHAKGAHMTGRELTIDESTTDVKLTIMASRGVGQITGTAITDNKPMAGAMIVLVPEHPVTRAFAIRRDQSDSDGTFTLAQIVPGKYTVLALRDGWELEWNNPEALRGFMSKGTAVEVGENTKQDIAVQVQ
jgi:hypothetical protein